MTACNDDDSDDHPEQAALDANRLKWMNASITSYVYTTNVVCFCVPREDIVVTVTNDAVTDGFYTPSGVPVSAETLAGLRSLNGFFDLVQLGIDQQHYEMSVRYDATYGFPERVYFNPQLGVADDEISYIASDFQ